MLVITIIQYNEQTRTLVEDLIEEFRVVRGKTENYGVLDNRLSNIEAKLVGALNECDKCRSYMGECLKDIGKNLQLDVSKLGQFEIDAAKEHAKIKEDFNSKIDVLQSHIVVELHKLDKRISIDAMKISGIAFVCLWVLKFFMGKLFDVLPINNLFNP